MFNSEHKFKTEKQSKTGNTLRFICAFLAFLLVFGSISLFVMMKNNNLSLKDMLKSSSGEEESRTSDDNIIDVPEEISGSTNFMFYCTDSAQTEIYFISVVTADMDNKTFRVLPVNTDDVDYLNQLKTNGYRGLESAVEKKLGIKIDKYAASNAETFALAINYMGGLEYNVTERIDYKGKGDFTLILTEGEQTIKGDDLIKFFRYAKHLGTNGMKLQGELVCSMLDSFINSENTEKGLTIFEKVLSKIKSQSDINHVEAVKMIDTLKVLCKSEDRKPASVVMSSAELQMIEEGKKK